MPWVRIDEHALNHVKILALSHGAFRLWVEGLAHCQKHLTDGRITRSALRGFRYQSRPRVEELTASVDGLPPLWEAVEDGFQVHDYLVWNDPKDKILHERQLAKDRFERYKKRVRNGVATPVHNHNPNHSRSENQERPDARVPRGRVFDGERLKVSQNQLDAVIAELGHDAGYVDFMGLLPKWDAELVASGAQFKTLNFLRERAEATLKALRAGGPLYSDNFAEWCHHEPHCQNRTWHAVLEARERGDIA